MPTCWLSFSVPLALALAASAPVAGPTRAARELEPVPGRASAAGAGGGPRALFLLGLAGAAVMLVVLVAAIGAMPLRTWSAARLAPTATLVYGVPTYAPADSGAVLSTLYGPVSVLWFLPAFLAPGITGAILLGGLLNLLALVVPFGVLLRARSAAGRGRADWLLLATAAAAALVASPPLVQMLGGIHVDALTVGLGLLSCDVLERSVARPGARRLALAALLVVLSGWTKQVEVPLALAQLAWLWARHGRATSARYLGWMAGWAAAASAVFLLAFDPAGLLFNLIEVPGGHPFVDLSGAALELFLQGLPLALLAALGLWCARASGGPGRRFVELEGALFLLGALVLLPTSLLARAKFGGFTNSFHSLGYLLACGLVGLRAAAPAEPRAVARLARAGAALALLAALALVPWSEIGRGLAALRRPAQNPQEVALAYAREHPGEVWFPWNPLSSLMGEGRLYHFEWAIVDRELAGHPLSPEHLHAHLPEHLRLIAFPPGETNRNALRWLPEFQRQIPVEGLEGWSVYAR